MHIFENLFLAIAANLDNLGIAIAYGMKGTKISLTSNTLMPLYPKLPHFYPVSWGVF